jgi:molybdate transport system substrate-binding protein
MERIMKFIQFIALLTFGLAAAPLRAEEVQVAVAASFGAPMKKIAAAFERETGHKVIIVTGSTGKLHTQIKNGAPFEVLLAADEETPAKLEKEGLGVNGSRFTYAIGKLVLWSKTPGFVDAKGEILKKGDFAHLAVANPKLAPYGAASVEAMKKIGVYAAIEPKIVQGENTTQTLQFVASGNAELGFVALSQVQNDEKLIQGSMWLVPAALHKPIRQDAVLLANGKSKAAATTLLKFLQSDVARGVISSYGYGL